MRSKLFVPGTRPELFAKALASDADAISFDVEDSVPEDAKARAREQVADFLRAPEAREALRQKVIIVRVNAGTSRHFEADLKAFTCPQVTLLNLPKTQDATEIQAAAAVLESIERGAGLDEPMRLLVNIETPRAVRLAWELARAHPRVAGLQLGLTDLFESLHIDRRDSRSVHAALLAVRLAGGESNCFTYDSAFPDVTDEEGFRREAELARRLGYIGKSCVHPRQVTIANEVFRFDELQLASARRIVAAAQAAAALGRGAFLLDGRMIDLPIIKRAEALLAAASEAPHRR
jgi:citrate lyase subunit beta/citryl-CoA lyase